MWPMCTGLVSPQSLFQHFKAQCDAVRSSHPPEDLYEAAFPWYTNMSRIITPNQNGAELTSQGLPEHLCWWSFFVLFIFEINLFFDGLPDRCSGLVLPVVILCMMTFAQFISVWLWWLKSSLWAFPFCKQIIIRRRNLVDASLRNLVLWNWAMKLFPDYFPFVCWSCSWLCKMGNSPY